MKNQYSIDEILSAVKELNSSEKNKKQDIDKQIPKKKNEYIPDHTIKLIEEAEKSKKND
jgi:hypothetical protein